MAIKIVDFVIDIYYLLYDRPWMKIVGVFPYCILLTPYFHRDSITIFEKAIADRLGFNFMSVCIKITPDVFYIV